MISRAVEVEALHPQKARLTMIRLERAARNDKCEFVREKS